MKRNELLRGIAIMAIIVAVTIGAAFCLNLKTGDIIEEKRAAAASGVLNEVFPGAAGFDDITSTLTIDSTSGVTAVYAEKNGQGYVFEATVNGFKQPVTVTVGVSADGKIVGLKAEIGEGDFPISDATVNSFMGQDSTLSGVVLTTGATISSNAVKSAVEGGFLVLTGNGLMKAKELTPEQVFEKLLPTKLDNFVKGQDLTVSGNIKTAYKSSTGTNVVCYVTKGEQTLLAISNASGYTVVYQAKLLDEATQNYDLEDVTADNSDVVAEVSAFATANIPSLYSTLSSKVTRLFADATDLVETSVNANNSIAAALTFTLNGVTHYAYLTKTNNAYNNSIVTTYVIIDEEGKIAKFDMQDYFGDEDYFHVAGEFNSAAYEDSFTGVDSVLGSDFEANGSFHISGATMTTKAIKQAINDAFAAFANKGGNN